MYVLVDRQLLRFCHKHHDHRVINALAHIELAHNRTSVFRIDTVSTFPDVTGMELRILYKQTTGHKFEGFSDFHLRELVLGAARALPESDVVVGEVLTQAATIADNDKGFYQYVKGSRVPSRSHDLYEVPTMVATQDAAKAMVAAAPPEPTAPDPVVANTSTAARVPSAPRGGNRATIFEVADQIWNAAGAPKDIPSVLLLRKQAMSELEATHGIKKTTSSTALGDWQKLRLNN